MTRKAVSIYMAATCAIVIVSPGRLVCGIAVAVELVCIMLFGLLLKALLKKMNLEKIAQVSILCFVIFFAVFYKQILIQVMPVLALQLSFVIFLPPISTFTTVFLLEEQEMTLKESLCKNMPVAFGFSVYILLVSLLRDVIGFGTITLPSVEKPFEAVLFSADKISFGTFFATIPGSLVLNALLLSLYLCIEKKFRIVKRAGE